MKKLLIILSIVAGAYGLFLAGNLYNDRFVTKPTIVQAVQQPPTIKLNADTIFD